MLLLKLFWTETGVKENDRGLSNAAVVHQVAQGLGNNFQEWLCFLWEFFLLFQVNIQSAFGGHFQKSKYGSFLCILEPKGNVCMVYILWVPNSEVGYE